MGHKINQDQVIENLSRFRDKMREKELSIAIVRATDNYLNEYIPIDENDRYYLSGFSGSQGDMLITSNKAYLFVDGRYYTQADLEVPLSHIQVVRVPFGLSNEETLLQVLVELINQSHSPIRLGFDTRKLSDFDYQKIKKIAKKNKVKLVQIHNDLSCFKNDKQTKELQNLESVPVSITGRTSEEKVMYLQNWLKEFNYSYLLLTKLDDLAYLSNTRSYNIPYNSSIKGIALISQDTGYLFINYQESNNSIEDNLKGILHLHPEKEFGKICANLFQDCQDDTPIKIAFHEHTTPYYRIIQLDRELTEKDSFIQIENPLAMMMRIKTSEELDHMSSAFSRADKVVYQAISWANDQVNNGIEVSEKVFSDKVKDLFKESSAKGLSFEVISAFKEHSAIIHYSSTDPNKMLSQGELMLLDTGAYFEGGYATDLTRTFLVGGGSVKATDKQKQIYTLVLKSAIRVMKSRFPYGTKGIQLDAIARSILWEYGYNFIHGTGHGVGICVHESPPRLSNRSNDVIQENMVFSVEPGIYLEGYGGVRIENLVTVEKDPEIENWLRIKPLTFAPLDESLIDMNYLEKSEIKWLAWFMDQSKRLIN